MKRILAIILTLTIILAGCASAKNDLSEPHSDVPQTELADPSPITVSSGQIYLYGEYHGNEKILDKELEHWGNHYLNDGMRHLFVELSYDSAEFLNLWMLSDSDDILDMVYDDWGEGANLHTPEVYKFYQTIKREYPETIFHGTDVGHTYGSTAIRFLEYLESNGLQDSPQYILTQEAIEQGQFYHANGRSAHTDEQNIYRENKMAENFIREFDSLRGESVMGIYGGAHTGLDALDYDTGTIPCMANQLKEKYGEAVHSEDLTWLLYEPIKVDVITLGDIEYEASYFGREDFTGSNIVYREIWRLENAYDDFKDNESTGDYAPYSGLYMLMIEVGQVFVIEIETSDGTVGRYFYRSDGEETEDGPVLSGFVISGIESTGSTNELDNTSTPTTESSSEATQSSVSGEFDASVLGRLDSMSQAEVDSLALEYIATTGDFSYVYNMCPHMSVSGIDAAVMAYLSKDGDIGLVGAMLPNMSKATAKEVADKYFAGKQNDDMDWIFEPYR